MTKAVRKYLAVWAEPEAALASGVEGDWDEVIVVPARRETIGLLDGLQPAAAGGALVILVVNAQADENSSLDRELLSTLRDRGREAGEGAWLVRDRSLEVLVVDRASRGRELPARGGVGLARKIGSDLALALGAAGRVASPWIHASDGDAVQPADRFVAARHHDCDLHSALTFPFEHVPGGDADVDAVTAWYERSLAYWVAGLRFAGSPYAFPTVGSTLAIRAEAYAQVRGFPPRAAGEDFYLLNKLAKVGTIAEPKCAPVRLRSRRSDRVPFGTGRAVERLLAERAAGRPFTDYDPRCFELLRRVVAAIDEFASGDDFAIDDSALGAREASTLRDTVAEAGLEQALRHIRDRVGDSDPWRQLHGWFDAFRTMRFVHGLRDRGLSNVAAEEALAAFETAPSGVVLGCARDR